MAVAHYGGPRFRSPPKPECRASEDRNSPVSSSCSFSFNFYAPYEGRRGLTDKSVDLYTAPRVGGSNPAVDSLF